MTELDPSALKARNTLLALFMLLLALDSALVVIAQDVWAISRILLTVVVMYFVMQGRKWAKWVLVSFCSLGVVTLIAMMLVLGPQLSTVLMVGSSLMVVLSAVIAIYLISNKDLNRYFSHKRHA